MTGRAATFWSALGLAGVGRESAEGGNRSTGIVLVLESLEDRVVPSGTPALDLTSYGAIGEINGAIFRQYTPQPTGTGVINSFVRLQTTNAQAAVEQGYNTGARPVQFDENKSPQFTRNLQLGEVPEVDIGGTLYREFLLDINQKSSQPYLSLDEVRLFFANSPNLTNYSTTTHQLAGLNPVYDLGTDATGAANWIKLDARLSSGSGSGDMLAYIPNSVFVNSGASDSSYVYLYSKFGVNLAGNGGFEEWAAGKSLLTTANGAISGTVTSSQTGAGVADVVVFLDTNGDGMLDNGEVYTTTNANGSYSFNSLAVGLGAFSAYNVTVQPPTDTTVTSATVQQVLLTSANQDATNVNFTLSTSLPPPLPGPGGILG